MSSHALITGIDMTARVYRWRFTGIPALLIILVWLGAAVGIGFWAGRVAQGKGRGFSAFFALGFFLSLCGIVPGLVVVIVVYAMTPESGPGARPAAGMPPTPSGPAYQPPPAPGAPPTPPTSPPPQASPSPQGGYQYQPGSHPPQSGPDTPPGPPPPPA
ncbi:MAG: hypothetical protein KKF41_06560 [Actinobacteria bacterium]|nr:hypothetical protein [Actinomycetota bacterium]MBU1944068.1 hypothetical protein [Actinomycetota bacterium]MBU2687228.1 hypothetical protein [Actinomycetota bacterium]